MPVADMTCPTYSDPRNSTNRDPWLMDRLLAPGHQNPINHDLLLMDCSTTSFNHPVFLTFKAVDGSVVLDVAGEKLTCHASNSRMSRPSLEVTNFKQSHLRQKACHLSAILANLQLQRQLYSQYVFRGKYHIPGCLRI